MTGLTHLWVQRSLRFSVLLAGLYVLTSVVNVSIKPKLSAAWKRWKMESSTNEAAKSDAALQVTAVLQTSKWRSLSILFAATVIGFIMGYAYRDMRQADNTYTLHDVHVIRKDAADRYLLATAYGEPFEATWCQDYLPHWEAGSTLKYLIYEDRGSCKSVSGPRLGFAVLRDDHGVAIK